MAERALPSEARAVACMEDGERALSSKCCACFVGAEQYEAAQDSFTMAGNLYKMAKRWDLAAAAFVRAAECQKHIDDTEVEVAGSYVLAGHCLKKISSEDAIMCYRDAVDIYAEHGRWSAAAKVQQDMAELLERDGALSASVGEYERAAELYDADEAGALRNKCLLRVANISAELGDYDRATATFEAVAEAAREQLSRWNIKEHLLRAGVCYLCSGEVVTAMQAIERYEDEFSSSFENTYESRFLRALCTAVDSNDVGQFTATIVDFDRIKRLDNWTTNQLHRIKEQLQGVHDDHDLI